MNLETVLQGKRILIVDDLVEARSALKKMVGMLGGDKIDTAFDGRDASKFIAENDYDLVLSDYNLGKGRDGQQVLEEARFTDRLRPSSLFILVTGENAADMVMGALEYEPDAYITKPFTLNMLRERLTRILSIAHQLAPVNQQLDENNIEQAIINGEQILAENPKLAMPLTRLLGKLLMRQQRYREAFELYGDLIKQRSVAWARLGQAICLHKLDDNDNAIKLIQRNLASHPMYVQCYDWLARIAKSQGKVKEAQEFLQQAVGISPKAVLRQMELGSLAYDNKDYEVAEGAFEQAVRLGRFSCYKNSDNYLKFAKTVQHGLKNDKSRQNRNRLDKALRVFNELREEFPSDDNVMFETCAVECKTFTKIEDEERALASAKRAENILSRIEEPVADQKILMAEAYVDTDQHVKAKLTIKDLRKQGVVDQQLTQIDELEESLNKRTIREYTAEINARGVLCYERGEYLEAIEAFDNAVDYDEAGVSVLLNAIQAKVSYMENSAIDREQLKDCYTLFKRIGAVSSNDERFERYDRLRNTYTRLKRAAGL